MARSPQGLPLLLHLHHLHEGPLGWGEDSRCVRPRIQSSPCRGIRKCPPSIANCMNDTRMKRSLVLTGTVYPGRHPDGELRAGGHGVQAEAQRPAGQHRAQVSGIEAGRPHRRTLIYVTVIRLPQTQTTTNPPIFEYLCILSQQQVPPNGRTKWGRPRPPKVRQSKAVGYLFVRTRSKQTSYCKHYLLFQARGPHHCPSRAVSTASVQNVT